VRRAKAGGNIGGVIGEPSPQNLIELQRRLDNILRVGTIDQVDHQSSRVRVRSGELLTAWLLWFEVRAGNVRTWCPPSVGEQCLVLSPGGELAAGMVLVGLPSDQMSPPSTEAHLHRIAYPGGESVTFDHASGVLTIDAVRLVVTGDVVASGISLVNHAHTGVTPGSGSTGEPQ
jgi:phage baseplate assembly protein gpV